MATRSIILAALLSASHFATAQAEPPPAVKAEVEYLLQSIETSGCTFFRNGREYSGTRAKAHLRSKYEYFAARDMIATTEDFIDQAATKSSLSGLPYKIRCGTAADVEAGRWLREALERYRSSVK